MTAKPKLALLLLIAVLVGILRVSLGAYPGSEWDVAESHGGKPNHCSSRPRPKDDIDARVKEAIAEYKKSECPKYSEAAPYHLSAAEVERPLTSSLQPAGISVWPGGSLTDPKRESAASVVAASLW